MTLTIGGAAVALAILGWYGYQWWRGGRQPKQLALLTLPVAAGALIAACTGGLLGKAADLAASGTNTAGKVAAGGTGAMDGTITPGATTALTPGGAVITLVALVVAIAVLASAAKGGTKGAAVRLVLLAVAGASLAAAAGPAGLLNSSLYALVNGAGEPLMSWMNGGSA